MKEQGFWIVWCPDGIYPPKHRHAYKWQAQDEADRLARSNPGKDFFVMQTVCRFVRRETVRVDCECGPGRDVDTQEIPF